MSDWRCGVEAGDIPGKLREWLGVIISASRDWPERRKEEDETDG
jgi:hypothetical protein